MTKPKQEFPAFWEVHICCIRPVIRDRGEFPKLWEKHGKRKRKEFLHFFTLKTERVSKIPGM